MLNLILTVLGALAAIIALFIRRTRKSEAGALGDDARGYAARDIRFEADDPDATDDDGLNKRRRVAWKIANIAAVVVAAIVFILTEDITQPMVIVDFWTVIHVIIGIIQLALIVMIARGAGSDEPQDPQQYQSLQPATQS